VNGVIVEVPSFERGCERNGNPAVRSQALKRRGAGIPRPQAQPKRREHRAWVIYRLLKPKVTTRARSWRSVTVVGNTEDLERYACIGSCTEKTDPHFSGFARRN
jgi:hypothetical protein